MKSVRYRSAISVRIRSVLTKLAIMLGGLLFVSFMHFVGFGDQSSAIQSATKWVILLCAALLPLDMLREWFGYTLSVDPLHLRAREPSRDRRHSVRLEAVTEISISAGKGTESFNLRVEADGFPLEVLELESKARFDEVASELRQFFPQLAGVEQGEEP